MGSTLVGSGFLVGLFGLNPSWVRVSGGFVCAKPWLGQGLRTAFKWISLHGTGHVLLLVLKRRYRGYASGLPDFFLV